MDHNKDYIAYNIKCFFKHYGLEQKIIKVNADCIILKKMTKDVCESLDFVSKYPEYFKLINLKGLKDLEKSPNNKTKPQISNLRFSQKPFSRQKSERSVNLEKNKTFSRSPHSAYHSMAKSTANFNSTKVRTPGNSANKNNFFFESKALAKSSATSVEKKITKKTFKVSSSSKQQSPKGSVKTSIKNPIAMSKKTRNTNHLSPKYFTTNKSINGSNDGASKNKTITNMKQTLVNSRRIKTLQLPGKIGTFKDDANRSISPIEHTKLPKENPRSVDKLKNQGKKKPTHFVQKKPIMKKEIHSKSKSPTNHKIKPKEMTLNTSVEKIEEHHLTEKDFSSKKLFAIYLVLHMNFLSVEEKIKGAYLNKELSQCFSKKVLGHELLSFYEAQLKNNQEFLSSIENSSLIIEKGFSPSKVAQNGLNFFSKEEEKVLMENSQHEDVVAIFKIILILLKVDVKSISEDKIISYVFSEVYSKYNITTLKQLFLEVISKTINDVKVKEIEEINALLENHPVIISSSEIMKYNRNMSYMTFIIKDIINYLNLKTQSGILFAEIRERSSEVSTLSLKITKIKNILKHC